MSSSLLKSLHLQSEGSYIVPDTVMNHTRSNPNMGAPAGAIDLIPPIGTGAGLPFTIVWADDLTDAGGAGTENYALFDTNLWANRDDDESS